MKRLATLVSLLLVFGPMEPSRAQHKPPEASHFLVLGVKIGEDSYESLQSKLGEVTKCHTPEHITIAGYKNSKEQLVFEFSEVGGGDITGFSIRPRAKDSHESCPLSPLRGETSELTTGGGIRLGITEKEFVQAFGTPKSRSQGGHWKYHWKWKGNLTDEEKQAFERARPGATAPGTADISVWVTAIFTGSRLSYFHISKLETL
jgi:hypothetical protein